CPLPGPCRRRTTSDPGRSAVRADSQPRAVGERGGDEIERKPLHRLSQRWAGAWAVVSLTHATLVRPHIGTIIVHARAPRAAAQLTSEPFSSAHPFSFSRT